jgi:hypothetical protein
VDKRRSGRITVPVSGELDFAKLPKGTFDVRVFPFAEVYLGNLRIGPTPVPPISVAAGSYELRLKYEGKVKKMKVTVGAGVTERVKVNLSR